MTLDTFASDRIIQTVVSRYKNKTNNNNNSNHLQLVFGLNHNKNNLREISQIRRTHFGLFLITPATGIVAFVVVERTEAAVLIILSTALLTPDILFLEILQA